MKPILQVSLNHLLLVSWTGCNILSKVVRAGGSITKLFNRELQIFGIKLKPSAVWDTILYTSIFFFGISNKYRYLWPTFSDKYALPIG